MLSDDSSRTADGHVASVFEDYRARIKALAQRSGSGYTVMMDDGKVLSHASSEPDMLVACSADRERLFFMISIALDRVMCDDEKQYMADILKESEGLTIMPDEEEGEFLRFRHYARLGDGVDGASVINYVEGIGRKAIEHLAKRGYRCIQSRRRTSAESRQRHDFAYAYVKDELSGRRSMVADVKDDDSGISFSVPGTKMTGRFLITDRSSCAVFSVPVNRVTEIEPVDDVLYEALGHLDIFDIREGDYPSDSVKIHVNISVQDSVQEDRKRLPQELERAVVKCREYHDILRKAGF